MTARHVLLLTACLIVHGIFQAAVRASAGMYFFAACWLASALGLGAIVGAILFTRRK